MPDSSRRSGWTVLNRRSEAPLRRLCSCARNLAVGSWRLSDRQAIRYVDILQRDRKDADYGPTDALEPYTEEQADERLKWANLLVEDLMTIL